MTSLIKKKRRLKRGGTSTTKEENDETIKTSPKILQMDDEMESNFLLFLFYELYRVFTQFLSSLVFLTVWVLPSFFLFLQGLLGFSYLDSVSTEDDLVSSSFQRILMGFPEFFFFFFTEFYLVLIGLTGFHQFHQVLLSFYWVLLCFLLLQRGFISSDPV